MEDTLAGMTPDDNEEWYDTAEALAQPLLACYWSLWECGKPLLLSVPHCLSAFILLHLFVPSSYSRREAAGVYLAYLSMCRLRSPRARLV